MLWETKKVLMFVKTYPSPSKAHHETVCTAGVTENGQWIRLYPVRFRYLDYQQRFKKYSWVSVETMKNDTDNRFESYKVKDDSIEVLRELKSTGPDLEERKRYILPLCRTSVKQIEEEGKSLGIFKPKEVLDFVVERSELDWSPSQKLILNQQSFFDKNSKPLEKIPYRFKYIFTCNDEKDKTLHSYTILDWETSQAFRNFRENYGSEEEALDKLKDKYMGFFNDKKKESYLIIGNTFPFKTFVVIGIFSFPSAPVQISLFDSFNL